MSVPTSSTPSLRGFESVAAQLDAAGLRRMFGLMGDANLDLVACCVQRHGMQYFAARTEGGAVAMADGCARVTGEVAVATVTCGPGLTNAVTALTTAVRAGTPLLLVCGQIPLDAHSRNQRLDHAALLAPTGAAVLAVDTSAQLPGCVARALELARVQHRPVVLNVMVPVLDEPADRDTASMAQAAPILTQSALCTTSGDAAAAELFAARLAAARRPVLLAGRGAVRAGALDPIRELADRSGAMLVSTLCAKDAFAGSPRNLGLSGGFALDRAAQALKQADLVIAFGASMNAWTTVAGTAYGAAEVMLCNSDAGAFGRASVPLAGKWQGDAQACARALLAALPAGRRPAWHDGLGAHESPPQQESTAGRGLDPRWLCARLDRILPPQRTLAVDGGHFFEFPSKYIRVPRAQCSLFTLDFGSIGLAMGMGLGAAVALPDSRPVIAVGDGGFMMALPELDTAVRHRLPALFVVFNDGAYGAEIKHLEERGWAPALASFETPDIARIARSMGARGISIRTPQDLEANLEEIGSGDGGPLVLDVHIDASIEAEWVGLARRIRGR